MAYNYTILNLHEDILMLYQNVNVFPFKRTTLPLQLKVYGDLLENFFDLKFIEYKRVLPEKVRVNSNTAIAFSGGKDSAALAKKLSYDGQTVYLYHFTGVNKAYPDEANIAERFATKYHFNFRKLRFPIVQKGTFVENIAKNQLLLAECLKYGYNVDIYNVGLGCASLNTELLVDYGFSDSQQSLRTFADGIEILFSNRVFVSEIKSEGESYKILLKDRVDFSDIVSCMMPLRYRGNLRKKNLAKRITIRQDGCGQCYKCAADYYYLGKVLKWDKQSDLHYLDVLKKHWEHVVQYEPKSIKDFMNNFLNKDYIDINEILNRYILYGVDITKWK